MKVELEQLQVQKLAEITYVAIYDDESFEIALSRLFEMYDNQRQNIKYLQDKCTENRIHTPIN